MSAQEILERGLANDMVKYCSVKTVSGNETVKFSRKKGFPKDFTMTNIFEMYERKIFICA